MNRAPIYSAATKRMFAGLLAIPLLATTLSASEGGFTDRIDAAKINYTQFKADFVNGEADEDVIMTGGAAAGDFDNDGWIDLYVTRLDDTDILYRNLGGETAPGAEVMFEDVTQAAGLSVKLPTNGAAWGDVDNDGDLDLYVATINHNRFYFYLNNGDGTFTEDAVARGLDLNSSQEHQGNTIAFGDYDRDGWLDIHTTEWGIDPDHPDADKHSVLLRNRGASQPGHYDIATLAAGVVPKSHLGFTSAFSDLDNDGWPDLAVASDFQTSELYWNNGDGTFTNGTDSADVNQSSSPMGSAIGDYNGDGLLDWFVTSIQDNSLYLNNGNRTFANKAAAQNVENGEWGWRATFFDMDNDGDLDLTMTNGWFAVEEVSRGYAHDKMRLWENIGGQYAETSEAYHIVNDREGRALLKFDYDNDGDLDLFVTHNSNTPALYRNDLNQGNGWLRLKLRGHASNRNGIGARIELTRNADSPVKVEEITGGGQFLGNSELIAHFGLGPNSGDIFLVRIIWPSGIVQELSGIAPDQLLEVEEPTGSLTLPRIDAQPSSLVQTKDAPMEISLAVSGIPAPAITWYKNGVKINGANEKTFKIGRAALFDSGSYHAVATNPQGTVASDPIQVNVAWDISRKSVARAWNEVLLDAIRKDFPAPTIHGRNLYHVSAAMWDAFWAYEPNAWNQALPAFHKETLAPEDFGADRVTSQREAISYAAYRLLYQRYKKSFGKDYTLHAIRWLMNEYGFDPDFTGAEGNSPAAVGNRIGYAIIDHALDDGSNERNDYADTSGYAASNHPLIIKLSGAALQMPNQWQPLAFDYRITQNGIRIGEGIQDFIGVNWRAVETFAVEKPTPTTIAIDPGPPPLFGTESGAEFRDAALEVIRYSSYLDPNQGSMIDISPGGLLNNRLGSNEGTGRPLNPFTGKPYSPNLVNHADYGRILAEFWADGPSSETPPGHWNALHNEIVDLPGFERRYGGVGAPLPPLEWDIQAYLALNGAMHDAAVSAWTLKRQYDYVRPISMIRYLGGLGQSSDPNAPAYHPKGLPLEPGLVEVITAESSTPGQRHAALKAHVGEIAIHAWAGEPDDAHSQVGGVEWIRAGDWLPYQRDTFVTPAFPAYVSGHSTFSRAAAEVMTLLTGSPYFPGGIGKFTFKKSEYLEFEDGPSEDVTLQWATYYDAADQAGLSRLYGGIHVRADDFVGRQLGARIGLEAFLKANRMRYGTSPQDGLENLTFSHRLAPGQLCTFFAYDLQNPNAAPLPTKILNTNAPIAESGVYLINEDPSGDHVSVKITGEPIARFTSWLYSAATVRFDLPGQEPKLVFLRLLGESASRLTVNNAKSPTISAYRISEGTKRVLFSNNRSWTDAENASLLEVAAKHIGLNPIAHNSGDAGLFLVLGPGLYELELGNDSPIGDGSQFEIHLLQ